MIRLASPALVLLAACAQRAPESESPAAAAAPARPTVGAPAPAQIDTKIATEYLEPATALAVRGTERRGSGCPRNPPAKTTAWKTLVAQAGTCVQAGNWKTVETLGAHLSQYHQISPWGPYFLSLAAESRKEFPRALWMIELALKKAPNSGLLTYQQGRIHWLTLDQGAALKSFTRAAELDKKLAEAHLILGQQALVAGNTDEAGKRFQLALAADSRLAAAHWGWAEVCLKKKDLRGAQEALAQAVLHQPSSLSARLRQARVFETLEKNYPEALGAYRQIRHMSRDRRLDAAVDFDIDAKIKEIEGLAKAASAPNQLSQRDPSQDKKGDK
jgi:tetratricopeptide (TPR) repeat protein